MEGENINETNKDNSAVGNSTDDNTVDNANQGDIEGKIEAALTKFKAELEAKRVESERLSKLSDDERKAAELETARKELAAQREEFTREQRKFEVAKVLTERQIPIDFVEYFLAGDDKAALKSITAFEKKFKAAVEAAVNQRLKGTAPLKGDAPQSAAGFLQTIKANQLRR